ncbi:MAG TPA: hypothetical protein ENN33_00595 [Ignavibacteria bacterium]|nr:hypothetical protein [Ignavibacteria bacterium]
MSKRKTKSAAKEESNFFDNLKTYQKYLVLLILLLIPIFTFMSPYIFEGKTAIGTDIVGSKGRTNQILEYEEQSGETALWNPSLFSGMPMYNRKSPTTLHIDSLISFLGNIIYHFFWYFLLGGLGLYLYLHQKKIPWYIAAMVATAFIALPDWQAMLNAGHFSKVRAIMVLPWLLFTFDYFLEKKNWFSTGLFALAFSWLVRTHHFQIVFYAILLLLFLYIYSFVKLLLEKKYKEFSGLIIKLAVAVVLTIMTAAQPMLATYEYADYSTRGGNPVHLGEEAESAARTGGVSFEYATRWSLAPREIIDFFIPRFTGGASVEIYDGNQFEQLKGQQVPGYWGEMPFTESYDAMGMILFLFALFGFVYYRKNSFVLALGIFIVFSVLLALGRHFPFLYNLFYENVPFFSKFRVPVMFAHITFIATFILGGFGLKALFNGIEKKDYKILFTIFGGGILFLLYILMSKGSYEYLAANEAGRYNQQTLDIIKQIRMEFLTTDTIRVLILVVLTSLVTLAFVFKKINKTVTVTAILILVSFEIFSITTRQVSYANLIEKSQLETTAFKETQITNALKSKSDNMRALVISNDFQSNYYAYFYPTINGYSAIKLQVIQDIIDHNLFKFPTQDRLNWNVINMLNGKYIVSSTPLNYPFLQKITEAQERNEILYENLNVQPKAWFVKEIKSFDSPENLVLFMNDFDFDPDSLALLVNPSLETQNFTGEGTIEVIDYTPNTIELGISTESEQFLVLSEVYYPKGWSAVTSNGEELNIEQTNHILRGVKVPAGNYQITFSFEPQTYYTSMCIVWVGNLVILLIIVLSFAVNNKNLFIKRT